MRGKHVYHEDGTGIFRITPADAGKTGKRNTISFMTRITPADAGKTRRQSRKSVTARDHPRGCGENSPFAVATRFLTGSPPRMRGKPIGQNYNGFPIGITPADAGKTYRRNYPPQCPRDHPRGCGENRTDCYDVRLRKGSPPRMRGKPLFSALGGNNSRITPADAGKTCNN